MLSRGGAAVADIAHRPVAAQAGQHDLRLLIRAGLPVLPRLAHKPSRATERPTSQASRPENLSTRAGSASAAAAIAPPGRPAPRRRTGGDTCRGPALGSPAPGTTRSAATAPRWRTPPTASPHRHHPLRHAHGYPATAPMSAMMFAGIGSDS